MLLHCPAYQTFFVWKALFCVKVNLWLSQIWFQSIVCTKALAMYKVQAGECRVYAIFIFGILWLSDQPIRTFKFEPDTHQNLNGLPPHFTFHSNFFSKCSITEQITNCWNTAREHSSQSFCNNIIFWWKTENFLQLRNLRSNEL